MSLSLRKWVNPKDGQVRYYVGTRYVDHRLPHKQSDRSYFYAGENGELKISYRSSYSGVYGWAAEELVNYLELKGATFAKFEALFEASLTAGGNFSESRYFKHAALAA